MAATSAVRRVGLESIVGSHPDFQLAGSFGSVASLVSFSQGTELDVVVIDSDSIPGLLPEPISDAAIVLLTEVRDARSISATPSTPRSASARPRSPTPTAARSETIR